MAPKVKTKSLADKANTPKNLAAAERARTAAIGAGEPIITLDNYNSDIIGAFSYYNNYSEEKDRRKWVQKYLGKDKASLVKLNDAADHDIRQVAILIRLADRGQPLNPEHTALLVSKLDTILNGVKAVSQLAPTKVEKAAVSIQDRLDRIANEHIGVIEGMIDEFVVNKTCMFSMKDYVSSNAINGATAKIIGSWFAKRIPELNEAMRVSKLKTFDDDEEQIYESYSYFSKAQLKKFTEFIESIVDACTQAKVSVVRKNRKVKVKPASDVVKRVKYMVEFPELSLKSEHPVKMVGCNEIWLYSTKYRRVTVLRSIDNDVLVIKGSTICNFDIGKSDTKSLRKPADFVKTKMAKRELGAAFKALTTKASAAKGRINEDTIILAAFM